MEESLAVAGAMEESLAQLARPVAGAMEESLVTVEVGVEVGVEIAVGMEACPEVEAELHLYSLCTV